jgi:hypothetical protein
MRAILARLAPGRRRNPREIGDNMTEIKKKFCSTGSHWATGEGRKIGTTRWICAACYARRKTELRNLSKNKKLAARGPAKR